MYQGPRTSKAQILILFNTGANIVRFREICNFGGRLSPRESLLASTQTPTPCLKCTPNLSVVRILPVVIVRFIYFCHAVHGSPSRCKKCAAEVLKLHISDSDLHIITPTFVVPFEIGGRGGSHLWNPNFESLNEAGDLDVKHRADRMNGGKWSVGSQRS